MEINSKSDVLQEYKSITLSTGHEKVNIALKNIIYIKAFDNYVSIYQQGLPTIVVKSTMKEMGDLLQKESFTRVHRSFIVPLHRIERFVNRKIYISEVENPIPVGRTYYDSFQNYYYSFCLKSCKHV